jgi:hypothetical protein
MSTYPISKPYLEDWSVLPCQLPRHPCVVVAKLQEVAKERNPRNLWEILDLGCICTIYILDYGVENGDEDEPCDLVCHEGQARYAGFSKQSIRKIESRQSEKTI